MNKDLFKKYINNLSIYFGAALIPMLLNLFINPWIAKNMSPKDYAITGYYTSYSSLIGPIITFYLIHYYIKEYYKIDEKGREILFATIAKALIWFSGIVSIICFCSILFYIKYLNYNFSLPISPYLAMAVFALPLTGLLNLQLSQYKMEKSAKSYFRLSVSNGIINILFSCGFVVLLKWGAFGKLLATLSCNLLVFIILLLKLRSCIIIRSSIKQYCLIFRFCLPLALSAMLGYFSSGYTTTYLEGIGDTNEYGIYVVGVSIGGYLTVFSTAINSTFQPDLYETTIKRQWEKFFKYCLIQLGLIALVVGIFIIFAPLLISLLTSGLYTNSTLYAQIISISTFTSAIYYLINNYCIATNRPHLYLFTTILGSVGIVLILPYAVKAYSYYGGCWVSVLSFLLFALINLFLINVPSFIKIIYNKPIK